MLVGGKFLHFYYLSAIHAIYRHQPSYHRQQRPERPILVHSERYEDDEEAITNWHLHSPGKEAGNQIR